MTEKKRESARVNKRKLMSTNVCTARQLIRGAAAAVVCQSIFSLISVGLFFFSVGVKSLVVFVVIRRLNTNDVCAVLSKFGGECIIVGWRSYASWVWLTRGNAFVLSFLYECLGKIKGS